MGDILQFRPKQNDDKNRIKALSKGRLKYYTCDSCGKRFEVDLDNRPDSCPHCGLQISGWND